MSAYKDAVGNTLWDHGADIKRLERNLEYETKARKRLEDKHDQLSHVVFLLAEHLGVEWQDVPAKGQWVGKKVR